MGALRSIILAAALAWSAQADAAATKGAGITIDVVELVGGQIRVKGSRLEGARVGYVQVKGIRKINRIGPNGSFAFTINRRPDSCLITFITSIGSLKNVPISDCGPKGKRGKRGPAGPTGPAGAYKRAGFQSAAVPSAAVSFQTAVSLASLNFTAPMSGVAVINGRGHCDITKGTELLSAVVIGVAVSGDTGFQGSELGYIGFSGDVVEGTIVSNGWSVERALKVASGKAYSLLLKGYRSGTANDVQCSGSMSVVVQSPLR